MGLLKKSKGVLMVPNLQNELHKGEGGAKAAGATEKRKKAL